MHDVYLLLGSSLGDRELLLEKARELITIEIGSIIKSSAIYETASWGNATDPNFLNQVLIIKASKGAREILEGVLGIENVLGRERKEKWGARVIDIDILFYDNETIKEPDLIIPHPLLHERRFTLTPLVEIAPELIHPIFKKTIRYLYDTLTDKLSVEKI